MDIQNSSSSCSRSRAKQASQADPPAIIPEETPPASGRSSENSETKEDLVRTKAVDTAAVATPKMRVIIKPKLALKKPRTRGDSGNSGLNSQPVNLDGGVNSSPVNLDGGVDS